MSINFDTLLVEDIELSIRTANLLKNNGITNMAAFMALRKPEVIKWHGAGVRTWGEIYNTQDDYRHELRKQEGNLVLDNKTEQSLRNLTIALNEIIADDPRLVLVVENGLLKVFCKVN